MAVIKPAEREIIEIDAKSVGYISVERHKARIFLASIEIARGHQSRGTGTQLIRALIEEADREGIPVDLYVPKSIRRESFTNAWVSRLQRRRKLIV